MLNLKAYRRDRGLTQDQVVDRVRERARARGDEPPGLDSVAVSKHENGVKRPCPYYQALYCEVYGASPVDLGFALALPDESDHHEDVDRREFLTGTAGFLVTAALPSTTPRLSSTDVARLRDSVAHLYEIDHQHGGAGGSYVLTTRLFDRLRGFAERSTYSEATGRELQELVGLTAAQGGWLAYDVGQHDTARRWWLEATNWSRLADSDSVAILAQASMALQASEHRLREAVGLAEVAQRTAGRTTPLLKSALFAREALAHAGAGDATSARTALRRARKLADQPRHDDDPIWLDFYGPASFAGHEHRAMLMLGDTTAAEEAARTALAMNNPVAYPRARALYLVYLADALVQRGELDEAAAVTQQASVAAAGLDSGRVTRGLRAVTQRLA